MVLTGTGFNISDYGAKTETDEVILNIKAALSADIDRAVLRGYTTFKCGDSSSFDIWFAEAVLDAQRRNVDKRINLIRYSIEKNENLNKMEIAREETIRSKLAVNIIIQEDTLELTRTVQLEDMLKGSDLVLTAFVDIDGDVKSKILNEKKVTMKVLNILSSGETKSFR